MELGEWQVRSWPKWRRVEGPPELAAIEAGLAHGQERWKSLPTEHRWPVILKQELWGSDTCK